MDNRVQIWQHFFPADAAITVQSDDDWLHAMSSSPNRASAHNRVLLSSGGTSAKLPRLDNYAGVMTLGRTAVDTDQLRSEGFKYIRQFAILPSLDDPRWFIPIGDSRLSSAALELVTPFKMTRRALNWGLKSASRAGIPGWYKHQMVIALRTEPRIERVLRSALEVERLEVMITTGTPGPTRKPTLVALSTDGTPLAYAKMAISGISEQLLKNEAACLRELADRPSIKGRVPRLLLSSGIDGNYVTVQEPVWGKSTTADLSPPHKEFLTCLRGGPPMPAMRSRLLSDMFDKSHRRQLPGIDLPAIMGQVQTLLSDVELPQTIVHGDFAPWNLRQDQSRVKAFDWEYGEIDGLPGLDELHFELSVGGLIKHWPPRRAADHLGRLQTGKNGLLPGLRPKHVWGLQVVYLLHLLLRYQENGYGPDEPEVKYGMELFNLFLDRKEEK